jgi:signal transduction histidine kinase
MLRLALIVWFWCCALGAAAQPGPLVLRDTNFLVANTALELWEDPHNALSLEEVRGQLFVPRQAMRFIFGYEQKTLWARFRLLNRAQRSRDFVVEVVNPFVPRLSCYQVAADGRVDTAYHTGANLPFAQRPVERRNFLFPIRLEPGDSCTIYLSIAKDFLPNSNVLVTDRDTREGRIRRYEDILLTLFFVFCTLYLLLSGLLFSVTRQRFQWYYFVYVLLTACFISTHLGHGFQYLWRDAPALQFIVPPTLNILRLIFGIQFFRLYFEVTRQLRGLNLFFNATILLFLTAPFLQVLYAIWPPSMAFYAVGMFYGYLFFCGYLVLFSAVVLLWALREIFYKRRRRSVALFIVVGLNFVGLGTTSLQYLGYNLLSLSPSSLYGNKLIFTTQTFFIPALVMSAFFLEILLVFNFSTRKYIRLFEKDQRAKLKIAKAREEGLQALIEGIEHERRRIARDLHDGACVNLAAINMQLDALREGMQAQPLLATQLEGISEDLEKTYREVRDISHDLMSKALEKTDLPNAIGELLGRCQQARPELSIQWYTQCSPGAATGLVKIHLYRIAQELVANVLKHAQATRLTVQLLEAEGRLLLTVEDNGRGFEPGPAEGGIGLANVRARAEALRGTLHLDTAPGRGTFVQLSVPVE